MLIVGIFYDFCYTFIDRNGEEGTYHEVRYIHCKKAIYYREGKEIPANTNLHTLETYEQNGIEIISYHETLANIFLNENVLKMLFRKEACPKE